MGSRGVRERKEFKMVPCGRLRKLNAQTHPALGREHKKSCRFGNIWK
jgi:hypothetical protein